MKKLSLIILVGLALGSCATAPRYLTDEQAAKVQACKSTLPSSKRLKIEAVSTGCMASFAFNRMINSKDPSPLLCIAGGTTGFLLGESIAQRKCSYLTLQQQVDGEIAHAAKINAGMVQVFAQQAKDLALFGGLATSLSAQKASDEKQQQALSSFADSLNQQIRKEQVLLTTLRDEISFKRETLGKGQSLKQQEKEDKLLEEINSLQESIARLQKNYSKLVAFRTVSLDGN